MGTRKGELKRLTRSNSSGANLDGEDSTMAEASLATGQATHQVPVRQDTEPNFQDFVRSALRDIQGQMSDFRDEIKTVTGELVRSVEFCTEEMKDLLTKVNSQSSELTELG